MGVKEEVIERIKGLKKDHLEAAIVYSGVATNAAQVRAPIDRSLPESSDNNSRTTDKGLQYLLELTEKARAAREAQVKKEYAELGAANPPPADRDARATAMQKSARACGQLKRELVQYKELMEANLLPNGRRMSKLLTEAERSTKAEAEKHTAQAAKMDEILARLNTPSDSVAQALKKERFVDVEGTPIAAARGAPIVRDMAGAPVVMRTGETPISLERSEKNNPDYEHLHTRTERVDGRSRPTQVEYYRFKGDGKIYRYIR